MSTLTPVTTHAKRKRHYLNPATGTAFCDGVSRTDYYNQAETDERSARWGGKPVVVANLPECGLCTKSPAYRRAVSGPGAVTA